MSLVGTPRANQLHIGIFGKRNSGKSSLINAMTGHETALVSNIPGTTTDPVYKTIEIYGLGPCVLIDTAGFDDEGQLGKKRVEKTKEAMEKTDIALIVCCDCDLEQEIKWYHQFKKKNTPVIFVLNKTDLLSNVREISDLILDVYKECPIEISAMHNRGIDQIREAIIRSLPEDLDQRKITGDLVKEGDVVLLVMPQDIQAPKGRLILPQVQTMRELLDLKAIVISSTADQFEQALKTMSSPPKLIITDSQVFSHVYGKKPEESMLTSFSVLFAAHKGDGDYFMKSAEVIATLTEESRVLIAEACTHVPLNEDIGRVKLPRMLRNRIGEDLSITHVSGTDFPKDLSEYDLVIQCGACMFNRKYVMSRVDLAKVQEKPMTNYGMAIAYLTNILDKITITS